MRNCHKCGKADSEINTIELGENYWWCEDCFAAHHRPEPGGGPGFGGMIADALDARFKVIEESAAVVREIVRFLGNRAILPDEEGAAHLRQMLRKLADIHPVPDPGNPPECAACGEDMVSNGALHYCIPCGSKVDFALYARLLEGTNHCPECRSPMTPSRYTKNAWCCPTCELLIGPPDPPPPKPSMPPTIGLRCNDCADPDCPYVNSRKLGSRLGESYKCFIMKKTLPK